ncbi:CNP1-like family protein [Thiolapillus sp.]
MCGIKQWFLISLLLCAGGLLAAPTDRYEELTGDQDDFEADVKEWKEFRTEVPPVPADDAWTPVSIDALPKNLHAYLDMNSLNVSDKDFVVRYWLLIRSDKGAYTASFEGVRCSAREYILYAWGYKKRTPPVRPVKQPRWRPLGNGRSGNYRQELAEDVFCAGETPRRKYQIKQAVKGLYEAHNPFNNWMNDD